jgi:hypothetical protein
MKDRLGTGSVVPLSEENLRIHDAACPKVSSYAARRIFDLTSPLQNDRYFQINLILGERAMAGEQAIFQQMSGQLKELEDTDHEAMHEDGDMQRKASLDALKLYTGAVASSETPMGRFVAMSPTHDTHPWMARRAMEETGIGYGDLETLDLRKLASDMLKADVDVGLDDTRDATAGSPRPSSDTLSIPRLRAMRSAREGPRVRKRVGMRKQKGGDHATSSHGKEK